jgi:hypothetical protein
LGRRDLLFNRLGLRRVCRNLLRLPGPAGGTLPGGRLFGGLGQNPVREHDLFEFLFDFKSYIGIVG